MARVIDLITLAKTSVASTDFFLVTNSTTGTSKKLTVETMFPSVSTAGSSSETIYTSATLTNKNQIIFKGIKSGDTDLLTVTTASNNIVLTALEAGIDLSLCNNVTSEFLSGVDFTSTITGACPVVSGGTSLTTIAKGSILYADATDSIAATASSTNGQILVHNATTGYPAWATLDAGNNLTLDVSVAGVLTLDASLTTMAADLDMANNDIDLGTGYISSDGSSAGLRATGNNVYIGANAGYFNTGALNIHGGNVMFSDTTAPTIKPTATSGGTAGNALSLESGGSENNTAGILTIKGADASGSGTAGHLHLVAGKSASGTDGSVQISTYTGSSTVAGITVAPEGQEVTINTGNLIMSSKGIFMRHASYPTVIRHQPTPATTDDGTAVVTVANILTGIVQCTPSADRSKATDTAANLISSLALGVNGDSFDFSFMNLATDGTSDVTLTAGSNVTLSGCMVIKSIDTADDAFASGSAQFRIRRTSGAAVTMYRIA